MPETREPQSTQASMAEVQTSLVAEILESIDSRPQEEAYTKTKTAVEALIRALLEPECKEQKINQAVLTDMIADLDRKLSAQVDEILHHETFQRCESAWGGLKQAVDRTNFRENIQFEILNVTKEELLADFKENSVTTSGLYRQVITNDFGQFGGKPIGAIIGNYEFGPGPQDVELLQYVASVATMAHAPFIAAASQKFFPMNSFLKLPTVKALKDHFDRPDFIKWNGFRECEDARSVALCLPRFLLRLPFSLENNPVKTFNYNESLNAGHDSFSWGNVAFLFATRLTDSFAKTRWCTNIIGPNAGGSVNNLPVHVFESMGNKEAKAPIEMLISGVLGKELADAGFIPLMMRKDSDNACFFSADSCQKPKTFGQSKEGKEAEANYRLGLQLPYLFLLCRLSHYIRTLETEGLGGDRDATVFQRELTKWLGQYISDQNVVSPGVRERCPIRKAEVVVNDVEGNPGWFRVELKVMPHVKYMGAFFTLSLVTKMNPKVKGS